MAHETEAACLLRTGAGYPIRLGLAPDGGDPVFLGVKPGAFSVYFGDAPIYHFDLDGRWQRAFVDGVHYLKGLDTSVHAVDRVREGEGLVLRRRALPFGEAVDLDDRVRATAIDLIDALASTASLAPPEGSRPLSAEGARGLLDAVASWDAAAWFAHRERYLGTYGTIPFLPPETSSPAILQATLGHARGLGFGGSAPSSYYERSPAEFAGHAGEVARLLGRRALQARQAFLAGADALRRPVEATLADLAVAAEVFPMSDGRPRPRPRDVDPLDDVPSLDGVHTFLHEFDRPAPSSEEWAALRDRQLRRLILGVESGSPRVRSAYGRDWPDAGLRAWVGSCPIGLGLVVVVGAGGRDLADEHVEATVALVNSLAVPAGTIVTLVDADELDDRPADARGFAPLASSEMAAQRSAIKGALSAALVSRKVKVTTYSTDKRWQ